MLKTSHIFASTKPVQPLWGAPLFVGRTEPHRIYIYIYIYIYVCVCVCVCVCVWCVCVFSCCGMTNTLRLHAEHLNVLRGILAAEGRGDRGVENTA